MLVPIAIGSCKVEGGIKKNFKLPTFQGKLSHVPIFQYFNVPMFQRFNNLLIPYLISQNNTGENECNSISDAHLVAPDTYPID